MYLVALPVDDLLMLWGMKEECEQLTRRLGGLKMFISKSGNLRSIPGSLIVEIENSQMFTSEFQVRTWTHTQTEYLFLKNSGD